MGYAPGEGLRLGQRLTLAGGVGPLEGMLFGEATEADDGQFAGILALEGVDASAELGQCGHGSASLIKLCLSEGVSFDRLRMSGDALTPGPSL